MQAIRDARMRDRKTQGLPLKRTSGDTDATGKLIPRAGGTDVEGGNATEEARAE